MSSGLHVVRAGSGPRLLFIHGSAADHQTWRIQLASALRHRFTLIAYDRRADAPTIVAHADDAVALLAAEPGPAVAIGSSFGAVVALDLVRRRVCRRVCRRAAPLAGAILIEPPLGPSDTASATRAGFLAEFDRRAAEAGGPAAGELFLRTVLGDAAFERIPRAFRTTAMEKFAEIRADSAALLAYPPRYAELAAVTLPILLVGGERSAPWYRRTLDVLHAALGNARLEIIAGAGHMLHAEAPRRFHALITEFAAQAFGQLAPA